mmetsp:Transcript_13588/g.23852  ORF Transcript_13588/g.23852 Transcript_13588/m.23852 type:complete len:616 (-) Transcript_13588:103-1950(-)
MVKHAALNKKSNNSDNPDRKVTKGNMRSKSTIMRLNMYRTGKPVRNKEGKIVGGSLMMSTTAGGKAIPNVARIAPNRRWFGNTRIISQNELDSFREEMTTKEADPYSIILRRKKIPMALLQESEKESRVKILETETFSSVFGGKMTRKRPKISSALADYEALMSNAEEKGKAYDLEPSKDSNVEVDINGDGNGILVRKEDMFSKGQSKRIWGELYKVLDCSDVILEIVDARNVPGTRCEHIENHIKKNASHKHLVIVLNKCDLVPNWVTRKWVKILSAKFPTLAFHASMTNAFGKGALISLLRQFSKLHSDKRQISVGVIGYPNSGKSSVINALMGKPCCKAAPVPGETKVWQYITLTKKIFLIDCPGVVYDVGDDEVETVLKGVVRAERLQNPADFVAPMLARVSAEHIQRQYGIKEWTSDIDFLSQLAKQKGKLLKGGEPDLDNVAKSMIYDWQRGKLPFFVAPPRSTPAAGEKGAAGLLEDGAGDSDDEEEEEDDAELEEQEGEEEGLAGSDDGEEEEEGVDGGSSVDGDSGVEDSGAENESVADSDDQEEEEEEEEEEVLPPPPAPKGGKKAQKVAAVAAAVPVPKPAPSAPPKAVAGRKRKGGEAGWDAI